MHYAKIVITLESIFQIILKVILTFLTQTHELSIVALMRRICLFSQFLEICYHLKLDPLDFLVLMGIGQIVQSQFILVMALLYLIIDIIDMFVPFVDDELVIVD